MGLRPTTPVVFLDTCPPSLQVDDWTRPVGHQYLRPEPHRRDSSNWATTDFGDRNPLPTILVTLGTVFHDRVVLSVILSGLADLNVNILATVGPNGDPAELEVDPSRVRIERFVPLDDLLTGVSAVVAHGGGGTVLATLSRGLPLVLVPQGADQFLNARQVAAAHAGIVLLPDQATPIAIGSALQQVLTDRSLRALLGQKGAYYPCALRRSDSILHLHAAEYIGSVFMKKENVDFLWVTQKELIG